MLRFKSQTYLRLLSPLGKSKIRKGGVFISKEKQIVKKMTVIKKG